MNEDDDQRRDLSFVVHNLTRVSLSPSPAEDLLDAGYREIKALQKPDGWSSIGWDFDRSIFQHHSKLLQLSTNPPKIQEPRSTASYLPKEWGTLDESESDFVSLDDLPDFENTDLLFLAPYIAKDAHAPTRDSINVSTIASTRNTRVLPNIDDSGQSPAKRRRLDEDFLHDVIPQPHYRPSPHADYLPIDTKLLTAYTKIRPTPITPFEIPSMRDYLATPCARGAWVVPVRGSLPWKGSTSALTLNTSEEMLPSGPRKVQDHREIAWTHDALVTFWDFLLAIQQSKSLGPISLSFYAKSIPVAVASNGADTFSIGVNRHPISVGEMSAPKTAKTLPQEPLSAVDHIKVYHDIVNTMYVRNILDAWGYQKHASTRPSAAGTLGGKKIRMFKGAVLALLNEKSEAVLML